MRVPQWTLVTICLSCITFQASSCLAQSLPIGNQKANKNANEITEYTDPEMGISFKMARDWSVERATHWQDFGWRGGMPGLPARTIWLRQRRTNESLGLYYRVHKQKVTKLEIQKLLLAAVDDKVSQQRERWRDYHIRAQSYEQGEIGGWPGLAWVADYTLGKRKMVEYLVWVRSETTLAQFFISCPADQLDQVRERVKPIIQSLRIR